MEIESDGEHEWEEEEALVYVDLEALVTTEELMQMNTQSKIKIIGLDDENPVMQINEKLFKGTYEYTCGTDIFFAEDPNTPDDTDPIFAKPLPGMNYKYFGKSTKILQMHRVFIPANDEKPTQEEEADDFKAPTPKDCRAKYIVKKTYGDALDQLLGPNERPPRMMSYEHTVMPPTMDDDERPGNRKDDDDDEDEAMDDDANDENYVPSTSDL